MGVTRRKFMSLVGGAASVLGAGCARWVRPFRANAGSKGGDAASIDVLVIGGGVQGLAVLRQLKRRGYSAALVTNAPLGSGQTLHSHGILNSGYPYPREDLRASLKRDWLPFAEQSGLQVYGNDRFYILTPPEPFEKLRAGWDAFGYGYEAVAPDGLPSGIRAGDQFRDGARTRVVKIDEYTFPKRQLVRILADEVKERILYGNVTAFSCAPASGGAAAVESVQVRLLESDATVTLNPRLVVTAAGTGTRRLVASIVEGAAPAAAPSADGRDAWKADVLSQVRDVACRRAHMLCIRGPRSALPNVNLLVLEHRLMIVTASVDRGHDRHSDDPSDRITWYVTPVHGGGAAARDVPDTAQGVVDEAVVVDGFRKLLKVFPDLGRRAADARSGLEFTAYAGYKQDVGEEKNRPLVLRPSGIDNLVVALPSLIPGAFVNANRILEEVESAVARAGRQPALPGATGEILLGDVTENTDAVEWMTWERLREAYPGIPA